MKFVLHNTAGTPIGEGQIAEPITGAPEVMIWRGDTFRNYLPPLIDCDDAQHYRQTTGQLLEYFQATPIHGAPAVWSSPTAIGRLAAEQERVDVVDSVAPGYVLEMPGVVTQDQAERLARAADPFRPRRRRGEPS